MEFWTRDDNQGWWKEWPDALQGLASLSASHVEVLLLSLKPDAELSALIATVRLVRKLVGRAVTIIIASPHPSDEWLRPLKEYGIDHVWLVQRPGAEAQRRGIFARLLEIDNGICPALHSRTSNGTTLSVCGCHSDRMVLARHHFDRWCLRSHRQCPHWREVSHV